MATEQRGITEGLDLGHITPLLEDESIRESKFFGEYLNRLVTGRDMHVIITAASETGVGKTTLAASLAILFDQQGWTADKAAVANAAEYSQKYDEVEPGSVLILDEAEKAVDARRGMTKESVEVSQAFATKRYQQVFGMLTAPSKGWVDNRLGSDAADYWIQALQTDMGRIKGEAKVYRLKNNEHYQQDYTERTEYIHWPNLDWHPEFQELDRRKRKLLESDEESAYVHKDDIADIKKSVRRETQRETEQQIIERMAASDLAEKHKSTTGFKQKEIGEALDVSRSRISQRLNSD
jgi:predicted XRE-type DNA-binding protein